MLVSCVIRLAPAALAEGVLAGEVEHVASGARGQFRGAAELAAWCSRAASTTPSVPEPRTGPHAVIEKSS